MVHACSPSPQPRGPEVDSAGEVQAIVELGLSGGMPFLAEHGVVATLYPSRDGGQLVVHAVSDLEEDVNRLALAFVLDLDDPDLPGTVDLAEHTVVLMEVDRTGEASLVLDGRPSGSAEVHGILEPGRQIDTTFSLQLPGTDEVGAPLVAQIDGSFSAIIGAPPADQTF